MIALSVAGCSAAAPKAGGKLTRTAADRQFLADVHGQGLQTAGDPVDATKATALTDDQLIQLAHSICSDLGDLPAAPPTATSTMTPSEYLLQKEVAKPTVAGRRTALAVTIICPQYSAFLQQAQSAQSSKGP